MPGPLRLVFAGTPDFAVPALQATAAAGELLAVYTQPDRPGGRGRHLQSPAIKQAALAGGFVVHQPARLDEAAVQAELAALAPDLLVVVAYGQLLPAPVLAIPRLGGWNLHASLLPRWRGAAPIARAIEAGDHETGVCLMQMERGLDTGPVLGCRSTPITGTDTAASLGQRLAVLGAELLTEALAAAAAGRPPAPTPQAGQGIRHARKLAKSEARLDWSEPAAVLERRVRAFIPWPVAEAVLDGERVRVHAAQPRAADVDAAPGTVLAAGADGIDVACGDGVLRLLCVQREGGRPLPARDYVNSRPPLGNARTRPGGG